jgi:hypothetical protein
VRKVEGSVFMKGDKVFFLCLNPAIGEVYRAGAGQKWIDVKWYDGASTRSGRYEPKHLGLINSLCNEYLERKSPPSE